MISIKELQTFVAIVQEKSFTKAAEKTWQSQSSVSKQLKKLENSLGAPLIERYERDIAMTDFGDVFYRYAVVIIENYQRAVEDIQELQQLQGGFLDIGASTLPGEYILPAIVGEFKKKFPNISIRMKIATTDEVVEMLKNRIVTIAFIGANIKDPSIETVPYIEDELLLVTSSQTEQGVISVDPESCIEQLIMRESGSGTRRVVESFLSEKGLQLPETTVELGSNRAILSALISGMGYSFLSKWVVHDAIQLGKIREIPLAEGGIKRPIYLATLKDRYVNAASREFRDFLYEHSQLGSVHK